MTYLTGTALFANIIQFSDYVIPRTVKKIQDEIQEIDPKKRLLGQFIIDPVDLDGFFNNEYGDYRNLLVITANIIKCTPEQSRHIYSFDTNWFGAYYYDYPDLDVPVEKDFCCFINRIEPNRQSWLYQLIRRNLFDRGFISFNGVTKQYKNNEFYGMDPKEAFEHSFQKYNSIFAPEHKKIKNSIPYKNFADTGDLLPVMLGSKFSLILETHFNDNRLISISEKTFPCLQVPRPWLLFGAQHSVEQLRKTGFDVLDDVVDHSYDKIADHIQRQVAILDQCEKLVDIDLNKILSRCKQAAKHNKKLLLPMKETWHEKVMQDYEQAKQQCLNL